MLIPHKRILKLHAVIAVAVVAGLCLGAASSSKAAPFTDNFGPLIAELQARAVTLSNLTDKVSLAQKKAIAKNLAVLAKPSTSEATDLKNAVKITKSLIKAFPSDFVLTAAPILETVPIPSSFQTILEGVFISFDGDASNLVSNAQAAINALPPGSSCQAKAQTTLNLAVSNLPPLVVTSFTTYSAALGIALKNGIKAQALAASAACTSAGGGGGGGGGSDSLTMTANGTSWTGANGTVGGEYSSGTQELTIGAQTSNNSSALTLVTMGITGTGTYTNSISGNYNEYTPTPNTYFINSGSVSITAFDLAHKTISGTFYFSAMAGTNTLSATNGTFKITDLNVQ